MPDHCPPKYLEPERAELWNGPPIMTEADKPVSFLVRGPMPRRAPPSASDGVSEEAAVAPRGLPQRRYKEPPERWYRGKPDPKCPVLPDDQIMDYGEQKYYADDHGVLVRYNPIGCPPEYLVRYPRPKRDLAEPIPGLSKPARGRAVPKAGNSSDPRRRHVCPVETCKKTFIKRDHLDRHIRSLHRHERGNDCHDSDCSFTSGRRDNMAAHERTHDYSQEIFLCSPEDNFKGLHLMNPQVAVSKAVDIKPFANIAIHPMALGLWVYEETERRKGFNLPIVKTSDIQRYFDAHPEEIESALRRDPKWEWRMPQAGPEFARVDDRCLVGKFKLKIKRDPEVEREGSA